VCFALEFEAPAGRAVSWQPWLGICSWAGMSKLLRGVAAGYGAKKLGGGCFGTIIVFVILWYVLGHFQIFQ